MKLIHDAKSSRVRRHAWLAGLLALVVLIGGGYVAIVTWMEGQVALAVDHALANLPDGYRGQRGPLRFDPWSQRLEVASVLIEGTGGERYAASRIDAEIPYRPNSLTLGAILTGKRPVPVPGTPEPILRRLTLHDLSVRQDQLVFQWVFGELSELAIEPALLVPRSDDIPPDAAWLGRQFDALILERLTLAGVQQDQGGGKRTLERLTMAGLRGGVVDQLDLTALTDGEGGRLRQSAFAKLWLSPWVGSLLSGGRPDLVADKVRLDELSMPTAGERMIRVARMQADGLRRLGTVPQETSVAVEGLALTTADLPWPAVTALLERIGYGRLAVQGEWRQSWRPEKGELELETVRFDGTGMGRATLSLRLTQVDAGMVTLGMDLSAGAFSRLLGGARLASARLQVVDAGLTARLIEDQAVQRGLTLDATRTRLVDDLALWLKSDRRKGIAKPLIDAADAFLRQPGQFTLTLAPKEPVALSLVMQMMLLSPAQAVPLLGATAQYQP